jgi:hypothetical protein
MIVRHDQVERTTGANLAAADDHRHLVTALQGLSDRRLERSPLRGSSWVRLAGGEVERGLGIGCGDGHRGSASGGVVGSSGWSAIRPGSIRSAARSPPKDIGARQIGGAALAHPELAAVHFTGTTATLQHIWRTVGANVDFYRDYPRIVGEAGGKDFILAHPSADVQALAVACLRGAFDYQGQKCAAASRIYVPRTLWPKLRGILVERTRDLVVGDPTKPRTHLGAVINRRQHAKHAAALSRTREQGVVIAGGTTDDSVGWFVEQPCWRSPTRTRSS